MSTKGKTYHRGYGCEYTRTKEGWESGCGYRVAYNKLWHYCPHCGRGIINLAPISLDTPFKKGDIYRDLGGIKRKR